MTKLILFASGSGTNVENIIRFFKDSDDVQISYVVTNNPKAYVIQRARKLNSPVKILEKGELRSEEFLNFLQENADLIILAGFLLKIPDQIVANFPDKIINIHPSLLPKYGGKGMYGHHVHEAVVANKETKSGITIHFVNENYDEGAIIFQKSVGLTSEDTPEKVAEKIHMLEQTYFPQVIHQIINSKNQ